MIVKEVEGSMIFKEEGSMIVRDVEGSNVAKDQNKENANFLTDYIK